MPVRNGELTRHPVSDIEGDLAEAETTLVQEPDAGTDDTSVPDEGADDHGSKDPRRLQLSVSLRGLAAVVLGLGVVIAIAIPTWLYFGTQHRLDALERVAADKTHAEKVALDYATEAAAMNYQDLNEWRGKLVAGTSPELNDKLTKAATQMEQILVPLEWTSTARPLAAKVRSVTGQSYVVDAFVSVLTKTVQAPEPLQSTATYSVTIDGSQDCKITDVGGVGNALGSK